VHEVLEQLKVISECGVGLHCLRDSFGNFLPVWEQHAKMEVQVYSARAYVDNRATHRKDLLFSD